MIAGFGNDGASGFEGCRAAASTARTSTARCSLATRGSPTGCSPTRSPDAAASRSSRRCRTSSSEQAHAVSAGAPGRAAAASRLRAVELALRPLRADELPDYLSRGQESYARDMVANAGISEEAAHAKAEHDWKHLLPDGLASPASSCSHSRTGAPASGSVTSCSPSGAATSASRRRSSTRSRSSRSSAVAASAGRRCWCSRTRCGRVVLAGSR